MSSINSLMRYGELNFAQIYLGRQVVQTCIDHCRIYPAFQKHVDTIDKVSFVIDIVFFFYIAKCIETEFNQRFPHQCYQLRSKKRYDLALTGAALSWVGIAYLAMCDGRGVFL